MVKKVATTGFWLLVTAGTVLIVVGAVGYFVPGETHPFLIEKEPVSHSAMWRAMLLIHVAAGIVCLPVCVSLFSRTLLRKWPRAHAVLGRVFTLAIVLMVPSGLYLAAYANGGILGTWGFGISGLIAFAATAAGVAAAVRGDFLMHRVWMLRSAAQVTTAITFRIFHFAFEYLAITYTENYLLSLWLSVIGNLIVAEVIVAAMLKNKKKRGNHESETETEIHRPRLGRVRTALGRP